MSEYIITDEQINRIVIAAANHKPEKYESTREELMAAEIVRCKDCTKCETEKTKSGVLYHCTEFECPWCGGFVYVDEYSFCSWGERREEVCR